MIALWSFWTLWHLLYLQMVW